MNELLKERELFIKFCSKMADYYEKQSSDIDEARSKVWEDIDKLPFELRKGIATEAYKEGILSVLKQRAYERPL